MNPNPAKYPGYTHRSNVRIDHIYVRNVESIVGSFVVEEPVFGSRDEESDHQPYFTELTIR